MPSFKTIRVRAAKRKGGEKQLAAPCCRKPLADALKRLKDDRALAEMTKQYVTEPGTTEPSPPWPLPWRRQPGWDSGEVPST